MAYVFYDTETTGTETIFDHISISTPHVRGVTD